MERLMDYLKGRNPEMGRIAAEMAAACERLWTPAQAPWFTDHTHRHSERIGRLLEQLLFGVDGFLGDQPLTAEEALVLIGSCYLHDAGMQFTGEMASLGTPRERAFQPTLVGREYDQFLRPDHPYILHRYIESPPTETALDVLGLTRCPRHLQLAIAEVSLSHGRWHYLAELSRKARRGAFQSLRLDLLGALLQVGDVLDVCADRVNRKLMEFIHLPFLSGSHWLLTTLVSSVLVDSRGQILVTYVVPAKVRDDHILAHEIRKAIEGHWIGGYGSEAMNYLRRYGLFLKLPELDDRNYENACEPMVVRPSAGLDHLIDTQVLRAYGGAGAAGGDEDEDEVRAGRLPRAGIWRAVIRALVLYAAHTLKAEPGRRVEDTDARLAWRCGATPMQVQRVCERLRKIRQLIAESDHATAPGRPASWTLRKYVLVTGRDEPGSVWHWNKPDEAAA